MCDEGPSHRAGDCGLEIENPAYDPEFLHKQDFKAIGRAIWWDNRL
jgi:phage repressor protein C with HTH and peptisase S24 domain